MTCSYPASHNVPHTPREPWALSLKSNPESCSWWPILMSFTPGQWGWWLSWDSSGGFWTRCLTILNEPLLWEPACHCASLCSSGLVEMALWWAKDCPGITGLWGVRRGHWLGSPSCHCLSKLFCGSAWEFLSFYHVTYHRPTQRFNQRTAPSSVLA